MARIAGTNGTINNLDTADRSREGRMRDPMHDAREAESDARNAPRMESSDYTWRRPMNLDAPTPRSGYVQRWVRSEFRTESDNLNWQAKTREGWRPRDPATVPEAESYFGTQSLRGSAVIRVGGLVLMEAPEAMIANKKRAIREIARNQERSVEMETEKISREGMRAGAPPIIRDETGTVTTGRRPETLAD